MIRTFRINDVLRCIFLNVPEGPNLAWPRDGFSRTGPPGKGTLWKDTLAQRRNRVTLAQWDGSQLLGLASASTCAEDRVWELDRLFLPHDNVRFRDASYQRYEPWESFSLELLRVLMEEVGRRRAQRVFLRLPSGSPAVSMARSAGFFPYLEETVLEGWGRETQAGATLLPVSLREKTPQEDHALFQLVSAATPQSVRVAVGLTFNQWIDTQKCGRRGRTEWVTGNDGRITGWLSLTRRRLVTRAEALADPGDPDLWETLVDSALAQKGLLRWLVPGHQELVASLLLRREFYEVARYTMLIKTLAVPVVDRRMAPVEA
jgi:hypothetical protein